MVTTKIEENNGKKKQKTLLVPCCIRCFVIQFMHTTIIQNVVVVNQPSATEPDVVTVEPNDHLLFAAITFVICALLGNGIALIFLIPALFLSHAVSL